ncbi:MAG: NAD(P)/FAD-dependent oxidoreductase, partial [bacterium]|nr:NAD(P)/FAD-dependent oxidoreductase [bacterium]
MILIVGGGAAGFFSAIHAKAIRPDLEVIILEKSERVLEKVRISGGGRCNVTHNCMDAKDLALHYPRGSKALLGPFTRFNAKDTWDWFESRNVPLKIERDGRVFPQSNSSSSIVECLMSCAEDLGVALRLGCGVTRLERSGDGLVSGFTAYLDNGDTLHPERIILATGSARGGYELARGVGHHIVSPIPSL